MTRFAFLIGYRQTVKPTVFDAVICRFESYYPSQSDYGAQKCVVNGVRKIDNRETAPYAVGFRCSLIPKSTASVGVATFALADSRVCGWQHVRDNREQIMACSYKPMRVRHILDEADMCDSRVMRLRVAMAYSQMQKAEYTALARATKRGYPTAMRGERVGNIIGGRKSQR